MRRRKARGNQKQIAYPKIDIDAWLNDNPQAMIKCTNQPGNLKISPVSCAKRYVTANEPRWAKIGAEPFNIFVFKMNLIPCRNCATGEEMAAKHQVTAAA